MILRKLLIVPIFFIFFTSVTFGLEIKIKAEIDNIIITNIDIENERKYLIFLNPKLKELNKEDLNYIVKNSQKWKNKSNSKNLNNKKRPVSVVADNVEVRNIKSVKIRINNHIKFKLLYDRSNSLTKKIKLEQLRRQTS